MEPTTRNEKNGQGLRHMAGEFARSTAFSFVVGPFITGLSSAINHEGFLKSFKEVITTKRGWKCNAELALVMGVIVTAFNAFMGNTNRPSTHAPVPSSNLLPPPINDHATTGQHAAAVEARRAESLAQSTPTR